jgi:hypothetical protein
MKIHTKIPHYEKIGFETLNRYLVTAIAPEPYLPGSFIFVTTLSQESEKLHIYVYLFSSAVGCRKYGDYHGWLPPSQDESIMKDADLLKLKGQSIANSYYYIDDGPVITYDDNGGYNLAYTPSDKKPAFEEDSCGERFRLKLAEHFQAHSMGLEIMKRADIEINSPGLSKKCKKKESITPFAGGGDNVVMKADNILVVGGPMDENFVESPVQPDDFEYKLDGTQPYVELEGQLKANILLLTAIIFVNSIIKMKGNEATPITRLLEIESISSYGLTFGRAKPIIILKLQINFKESTLIYQRRYHAAPHLPPEPRVDCAITFLCDRMTSPAPTVASP